jgi:hypothetical protein
MSANKEPDFGFGYIYILSNPSMPGVFKIGLTTNSVKRRIQELNTTGIPKSFRAEKIFQIREIHLRNVEQLAHKKLKNKDLHHGKEFFEGLLTDCVQAVEDAIYEITNEHQVDLIGEAKERAEAERRKKELNERILEEKKVRLSLINKQIDVERQLHVESLRNQRKKEEPFLDKYVYAPLGYLVFGGITLLIASSMGPIGWLLGPIIIYIVYKYDRNDEESRLNNSALQKFPYKTFDNFEIYEAELKKSQKLNQGDVDGAKKDLIKKQSSSPVKPLPTVQPFAKPSIKVIPVISPNSICQSWGGGNKKTWYRSADGIGDKQSDLFFSFSETLRTMVPSSGYDIRRPYLYKALAGKSFVKDVDIESPVIKVGKVEISCPSCGDSVEVAVFKNSKIVCPACKVTWNQKL